MNIENELAIVVPYFKINYFEELLEALNNQTCQKFNIYIGDDCSDDSPMDIIDNYKNVLNISYHRFENNLGSTDLVAQWKRCLEGIKKENWIWLLPDDDLPSENVVEEFYKGLELKDKYNIKVFRMPMNIIDKSSQVIEELKQYSSKVETNLEFYTRVLSGMTSSSLGDNIFNKKSLMSKGALVSFPKAWGSDHAAVLFSSQGGKIYLLSKTKFSFRMSGENISSDNSNGLVKLNARMDFLKWLKVNESIFSEKPNAEFYKSFYWKSEYYVLNNWKFKLIHFFILYQIRKICFKSNSLTFIMKIIFKKIYR